MVAVVAILLLGAAFVAPITTLVAAGIFILLAGCAKIR